MQRKNVLSIKPAEKDRLLGKKDGKPALFSSVLTVWRVLKWKPFLLYLASHPARKDTLGSQKMRGIRYKVLNWRWDKISVSFDFVREPIWGKEDGKLSPLQPFSVLYRNLPKTLLNFSAAKAPYTTVFVCWPVFWNRPEFTGKSIVPGISWTICKLTSFSVHIQFYAFLWVGPKRSGANPWIRTGGPAPAAAGRGLTANSPMYGIWSRNAAVVGDTLNLLGRIIFSAVIIHL